MAHISCRAISAATSRAPVAFGCACVRKAEHYTRHWRQTRVSVALSDPCPLALISEQATGTSVRHQPPSQAEDTQTVVHTRDAHPPTQQRCLTHCSRCASWESSPSPPPATSRTVPVEGNERCRRRASDRWGSFSCPPCFLPRYHLWLCEVCKVFFFLCFGGLGLEMSLSWANTNFMWASVYRIFYWILLNVSDLDLGSGV